jgi:hypothetical protein
MKPVVRATVALSCLTAIALLVCCGGGQSALQPSPLPVITTASLPNDTAETPYSQTIQANGGVAPFSWTTSAGALPHNLSLSSSATNTATISGTPDTVAQAVAFTIKVTDSANHSATQPYTISILPEPDTLSLVPASLNFSPQVVGSASGARTETLTNTGASVLNIASIAIVGNNATEFRQSATTCGASLAPGANCTINVTFTPSQTGPRSASITISDDTGGSPQSVSFSGTGLTPGPNATLSATSLTFGSQAVNTTSQAQSVTLSNYGTAALDITGVTATVNFSETDNCMPSVVSAASCTINVIFAPGSAGSLAGTVSVMDNAPRNPQTVLLSGFGGATTTATLAPSTMSFSCVASLINNGCTPPQNATLTNSGSSSLYVLGISLSGQYFSQVNNCPNFLQPRQSCVFTISFDGPASRSQPGTKKYTGALSVSDNTAGNLQQVSLTGTTLGVP